MNNILNNNHALEDIEGVILALKHGGGGGGGDNIFIVKYNETPFEDVVSAYDARKTLLLLDSEIDEEGEGFVSEYWGYLQHAGVYEGTAIQFMFVSMCYFPDTYIYYLNSDGWSRKEHSSQFVVQYNETTYEEAISYVEGVNNIILIDDEYDDEEWSWYNRQYATLTSHYSNYNDDTAYIEFTRTEIKDDQIITTRYRLNNNDEYTKTVWKTDATLVNA